MRSIGGVDFWTNTAVSTGCRLAAGGGPWICTSDRDAKENWIDVDPRAVLETLVDVPIGTWNYKGQQDSVVHMGPAAQDLHAAFGLGEDERGTAQVDADGINMAAIQGLYEVVQEQETPIAALEGTVAAQQADLDELGARLAQLEAMMAAMMSP